MVLSPAYDLVKTRLVYPADQEEFALTLNGKKNRIHKSDFIQAMSKLGLNPKQQTNIFDKMLGMIPKWMEKIEDSFLSDSYKEAYKLQIKERVKRIILNNFGFRFMDSIWVREESPRNYTAGHF